MIDGAGEHAFELGVPHPFGEGRNLGRGFGDRCLVLLRRAQFEKDGDVVGIARELVDGVQLLLEARALAVDCLGLFCVVPKPGRESFLLECLNLGSALGDVKDAPLAP
jgi:hypothetical protein